MNLLKTATLMLIATFTTIFFGLKMYLGYLWAQLRRYPYPSNSAHNIATQWGQALFRLTPGWKIEVLGRENIPKEQEAYVIVANHESAVDIYAIYFLGIQFRWLSKDSVFKVPVVGRTMKLARYIPIKRGNKESHHEAFKQSSQHLKEKTPMLFFPEGTRSTSGKPKDFKKGAFKLAHENHVSILPIVLLGAGKLLKKNTFCPNKATMYVKILPQTFKKDSETVEEFTKRVQDQITLEHLSLSQETNSEAITVK